VPVYFYTLSYLESRGSLVCGVIDQAEEQQNNDNLTNETVRIAHMLYHMCGQWSCYRRRTAIKRSDSSLSRVSRWASAATLQENIQTLDFVTPESHLSNLYIAMFSKVFHKATHNGSVVSWAFHDDSFTEATKGNVFVYQVSHQDIKAITPHTLVIGGVCDEDRTATKVHRQLVKLNILTQQDNHLNAAAINGAAMAKNIVLITRHKLSLLVNLLFWWEEEMDRWDNLEARKVSYAQQLEEAHPNESVEERTRKASEAAKTITMMQREMPSQRQEGKETSWNTTGGSRREWELMELEKRVAERGGSTGEAVEDEGDLPAYEHGMVGGRD
jgi:hypothetical protein